MALEPHGPPAVAEWREHRSVHFRVRTAAGSLSERDVGRVTARLEALREAMVAALELDDGPDKPVGIVLLDALDGPHVGHGPDDGDVVVHDDQIQAVHRSDSAFTGLERAVAGRLLERGIPLDVAVPPALLDGVLGHAVQIVDGLDPAVLRAAVIGQPSHARPALTELLSAHRTAATPAHRQVLASFVAFVLATEGAPRFKAFARAFDPATPDRAADEIYGRPLAVLERAWLRALRVDTPSAVPRIGTFLRRSAVYLRPYWRLQLLIFAGTLVGAGFTVVQPLALQWLIDRAIVPRDYRFLAMLMGGLAVLFVLQGTATLGVEYLNARVAARVLADIRLQLFRHLQRLSMGFHAQAQVGDLMSRLSSDLYVIQGGMTGTLVQVAYLAVTVIASAGLLVALEWRLGLLALAVAPMVLLGPRLFGARAAEASYRLQQDTAAVSTVLQENLSAQLVVKAFGLEGRATAAFGERAEELARATVRATFLGSLLGFSGSLTITFIQLLTFALGAYLVMGGDLSLGALIAFNGLLANVLAPIHGFSDLVQNLQQATGGLRRVEELLAEEPQVADTPDAVPLPRPRGEIRFEGVTFSYTGDQVNLRDVDLTIPAGVSVAFVGPSGCGKSTVLGLILRLYDPVSGAVRIDDRDLRHVTQASLRAQVALVPQDTFLFNMSLRENIRLARPEATDEEVEAAARAAEIHDVIAALPQGYETAAGERGSRLSGGQRQRIALARAILRDAAILLLDEATSALDPQSEAAINVTLGRLAERRTVVAVTHRLASVVDADRIYVLDQGRLVQEGRHDDLLREGGLYAQLWRQQGVALAEGGRLVADVSRLQAVPLFASLDGVLLAALARELVTERYADGQVIFVEGQPGDRLYVIVEGQVDVVAIGPAGVERRVALLRTGDYFGEMALLGDAPRSATVRARGPVTVLALDRLQFATLLDRLPPLRAALTAVVDARRRVNRRQLAPPA